MKKHFSSSSLCIVIYQCSEMVDFNNQLFCGVLPSLMWPLSEVGSAILFWSKYQISLSFYQCIFQCIYQYLSLKPRDSFSSVQSLNRVRLCNTMNRSTPGLPVHHQLPEFTQTHVHLVSDAIQPSHPVAPFSSSPNPSQHQSLFQCVKSSHEVAKVLEFHL